IDLGGDELTIVRNDAASIDHAQASASPFADPIEAVAGDSRLITDKRSAGGKQPGGEARTCPHWGAQKDPRLGQNLRSADRAARRNRRPRLPAPSLTAGHMARRRDPASSCDLQTSRVTLLWNLVLIWPKI